MAEIEKSLPDRIREYANKYHISVSPIPLENRECDFIYHRQTKVFKIPLTKLSVNYFESLCIATHKALNYASRFQELVENIVDFPSHVLPILECYVDEENFLFLRIPFGSSKDKTLAHTLHAHIIEGKWISEKILLRWTVQLLCSLLNAHKNFMTFPAYDINDIFLQSDELILSAHKMHLNAIKQRELREEEEKRRARIASRNSRPTSSAGAEDFQPSNRPTMVKFPPIGRGAYYLTSS